MIRTRLRAAARSFAAPWRELLGLAGDVAYEIGDDALDAIAELRHAARRARRRHLPTYDERLRRLERHMSRAHAIGRLPSTLSAWTEINRQLTVAIRACAISFTEAMQRVRTNMQAIVEAERAERQRVTAMRRQAGL